MPEDTANPGNSIVFIVVILKIWTLPSSIEHTVVHYTDLQHTQSRNKPCLTKIALSCLMLESTPPVLCGCMCRELQALGHLWSLHFASFGFVCKKEAIFNFRLILDSSYIVYFKCHCCSGVLVFCIIFSLVLCFEQRVWTERGTIFTNTSRSSIWR